MQTDSIKEETENYDSKAAVEMKVEDNKIKFLLDPEPIKDSEDSNPIKQSPEFQGMMIIIF